MDLQPDLREINFGEWEGLSWEQIEQRDAIYAGQWLAAFPRLPAPRGERFQAFEARVVAALDRLMAGDHGPIAVVTHAGVLRVVSERLFGCTEPWKQPQPYCGILQYESRVPEVIGGHR